MPVDLSELEAVASERVLAALKKVNDVDPDTIRHGLEELTSLTKRTDDVPDCLDVLLRAQLLQHILTFLDPAVIAQYPGEVSVRGLAVMPVVVPLGEAIQLAACTALGELIWQRDTSSEVRPVLLEVGGMAALANLLANTSTERVRLKVLVLTRRMLYEVGSTATMDPAALTAAQECDLLGVIVSLLDRVMDEDIASVTMDTLEGVTYLLQRMQVCMSPDQKALCGLPGHLRHAAQTFTSLLKTHSQRKALDVALLGVRELCWDDHNDTLDPAISAFAEVGAFEAIAGLLAPPSTISPRPSLTEADAQAATMPLLAAVAAGVVNKQVVGVACQLLERLAAAKPGALPASLEVQVPRLFHQVVHQLVDQLDHSLHAPDRQEVALFALRKLLVTEHSQHVSKPAAEAADAEGVPARLLAVAMSGEAFGRQSGDTEADVAPESTARSAAALLAELTASTAMLAAQEGRPAQAADALVLVEPLVAPLVGQLSNDVDACRSLCRMLYRLSVVRWDEPKEIDADENVVPRAAPPEEEQYQLSSQLVTVVGKVAQGMTGLLNGGWVPRARTVASTPRAGAPPSVFSAPPPALAAEASGQVGVTAESLAQTMSQLQRATLMMHELAGLKAPLGTSHISKHNIDALFVHGSFQALLQQVQSWYTNKRASLRAAARAEAAANAAAGGEVIEDLDDDDADDDDPSNLSNFKIPSMSAALSRASSMSANANPLLYPLLNQETGALELLKELVRDCAEARIRLRDISALPLFARMLSDNPRDNLLVSLQFNLARSEALHAALRQEGCIPLMEKVLAQAPQMDGAQHEVRRLLSLCVLGLVSSDSSTSSTSNESDLASRRAAALLEKHDMIGVMEKVLREACRDGCYVINNSTSAWPFTLEPAAYTASCLARNDATARKLFERKIPAMLLNALCNKHGSAPEPALRIMRALLNFARLPDLRAGLLALDAADVLMPYTMSEDLRTCDAARGCLLQLGELPDLPAKVALQGTLPESLHPVLTQPLPGHARSSETGGPGVEPVYDVLLSYKRQDAHALARALHTTLVLRGVGCLLDYEYQDDLSDVERVVARARNLVLILTDNCLTSPRCQAELFAAAQYDVNVIMVVKEGARWGDTNGNMLSQPPQQTIRALRPELHKLFAMKAVHHRDEHYAYFVTQLLKRVKTAPAPALRPSTPSLRPPSAPLQEMSMTIQALRAGSVTNVASLLGPGPRASVAGNALAHASSLTPGQQQQPAAAAPAPPAQPPAISASELQALMNSITSQTNLVAELQADLAAIKSSVSSVSSMQAAMQSMQSELAVLRRELSAEVLSSGRQVTSELAAMSQQVRQALTGEVNSQGAAMANLKAEVAATVNGGVSSIKTELSGALSMQLRPVTVDVSELRRGIADCLANLAGIQGQIKVLASKSEMGAAPAAGMLNSSLRPSNGTVLTAVHADGAVYHSSPIKDDMALLQPLSTGAASSPGMLPPIQGNNLNGTLTNRSSVRASPTKQTATVPLGYAPNVGGFQGARIAAVQAKLNSLPRGRQ